MCCRWAIYVTPFHHPWSTPWWHVIYQPLEVFRKIILFVSIRDPYDSKGNQQLNFNNLSMDLVALWHAGSSQIREWTHVFCVGRQILYHWGTREAPNHLFLISCAKNIHEIYRQQCFLCKDYFGGFYPHEYWTFIKEYFYKEFKTIISQIGDFMFANFWNCILCILNGI